MSPVKVLSGQKNRLWTLERAAADGTLFVMAFNCSADTGADLSVEPRGAKPQRAGLPPHSYRLMKFTTIKGGNQ